MIEENIGLHIEPYLTKKGIYIYNRKGKLIKEFSQGQNITVKDLINLSDIPC